MRITKLILILSFFLYPVFGYSLVRVKNVYQTGIDNNTGQIVIEFNDKYNSSADLSFKADHIELLIPNAFIIPVRREFKASSNKSSVLKMEASQVPGNSVKLLVYFRVPIKTIKNTSKLSDADKKLLITYSLTEKKDAAIPISATVASTSDKQETNNEASAIEDNEGVLEQQTVSTEQLGSNKGSFFWVFVRMIMSLALVLGVLLGGVYLAKKYFSKIPGLSTMAGNSKIKIITSFSLAPGRVLYILDVMGEKMLIASTKENISMLAILGEGNFSEEIDEALDDTNTISGNNVNIRSKIKSELKERLRSIKGL